MVSSTEKLNTVTKTERDGYIVIRDNKEHEYRVELLGMTIRAWHIETPVKGAMVETIDAILDFRRTNNTISPREADGMTVFAKVSFSNDVFTKAGNVIWGDESSYKKFIKFADKQEYAIEIVRALRAIYQVWLAEHFNDGAHSVIRSFDALEGYVNADEARNHMYRIRRALIGFQNQITNYALTLNDDNMREKIERRFAWIKEASTYLNDVRIEKMPLDELKQIAKRWRKLIQL